MKSLYPNRSPAKAPHGQNGFICLQLELRSAEFLQGLGQHLLHRRRLLRMHPPSGENRGMVCPITPTRGDRSRSGTGQASSPLQGCCWSALDVQAKRRTPPIYSIRSAFEKRAERFPSERNERPSEAVRTAAVYATSPGIAPPLYDSFPFLFDQKNSSKKPTPRPIKVPAPVFPNSIPKPIPTSIQPAMSMVSLSCSPEWSRLGYIPPLPGGGKCVQPAAL